MISLMLLPGGLGEGSERSSRLSKRRAKPNGAHLLLPVRGVATDTYVHADACVRIEVVRSVGHRTQHVLGGQPLSSEPLPSLEAASS